MKHYIAIPLLIAGCSLSLWACKAKSHEEIDLSSIHTTQAETAKETSEAESMSETVKETGADKESSVSSAQGVKSSILTYKEGGLSIQYPSVALEDSDQSEAINQHLKDNALAVIDAQSMNKENDTLDIKCKVISVSRKRLTVTYTGTYTSSGAAHPVNLFYTNTVDLSSGRDIGLNDFADAYTLAGYVLSDDCQFYQVTAEVEKEAKSYKNTLDLETLTALFESADFPIDSGQDKSAAFPESFSYESQGTIYFSLPVSHALGDYVIVKFTPETK